MDHGVHLLLLKLYLYLLLHYALLLFEVLPYLLINLTLGLLLQVLLVHHDRLLFLQIRVFSLTKGSSDSGLIVKLLDLLVNVSFVGCLVESIIKVLSQHFLFILFLQGLYETQSFTVGLLSGFRVDLAQIDLLILILDCLRKASFQLLNFSIPGFHGHFFLLLLKLHLFKLLFRVYVLLEEPTPILLHYNDLEGKEQIRSVGSVL